MIAYDRDTGELTGLPQYATPQQVLDLAQSLTLMALDTPTLTKTQRRAYATLLERGALPLDGRHQRVTLQALVDAGLAAWQLHPYPQIVKRRNA